MSRFEDLRFFATAPHPCSYLEGQEATTLFVDPEIRLTPDDIARLTYSGFRRSGRYTYRPPLSKLSSVYFSARLLR